MNGVRVVLLCGVAILLVSSSMVPISTAWSNGGYSSDPLNPDYGTHDWIAEHALAWLPMTEKKYIVDNLAAYLYGTELPDNDIAPDGIGDRYLHHVYYYSDHSLQDDAAAVRASEEFNSAITYLNSSNGYMAAKVAGIMAGYLTDLAVFGHVMGSGTDWGAEAHHSDYESYVDDRTGDYVSYEFDSYLVFDGFLEHVGAYDATLGIAFNTTFGDGFSTRDCVWMDDTYDWTSTMFKDSAGASLNRATNVLADVLHSIALEAGYEAPDTEGPVIIITSPTTSTSYLTASSSVMLSGTAYDDVGVVSVTWRNSATGSSGVATGTTRWSADIDLTDGVNAIKVTAKDATGKEGEDMIGVRRDITPPTVRISYPWDNGTWASKHVNMSGSAWDDVMVLKVQVSLDRVEWADCEGTTSWSCEVEVDQGKVRIYVKATDILGHSNTTSILLKVQPEGELSVIIPYALAALAILFITLVLVAWIIVAKGRKRG